MQRHIPVHTQYMNTHTHKCAHDNVGKIKKLFLRTVHSFLSYCLHLFLSVNSHADSSTHADSGAHADGSAHADDSAHTVDGAHSDGGAHADSSTHADR